MNQEKDSMPRNKVHHLFFTHNIVGPCARSDWSKTYVLSQYKTWKKRFLLFFATLSLYHKANEET